MLPCQANLNQFLVIILSGLSGLRLTLLCDYLALLAFVKVFIDFLHFLSFFSSIFKSFFFHFLFKDPYHLHKVGFKVIFLCDSCVGWSGLAVTGQLGSGGTILTCLWLMVFLPEYSGLWIWDDYRILDWDYRIIGLGADYRICICWMGVFFLHLCSPFGLLVFVAWISDSQHDHQRISDVVRSFCPCWEMAFW